MPPLLLLLVLGGFVVCIVGGGGLFLPRCRVLSDPLRSRRRLGTAVQPRPGGQRGRSIPRRVLHQCEPERQGSVFLHVVVTPVFGWNSWNIGM